MNEQISHKCVQNYQNNYDIERNGKISWGLGIHNSKIYGVLYYFIYFSDIKNLRKEKYLEITASYLRLNFTILNFFIILILMCLLIFNKESVNKWQQ